MKNIFKVIIITAGFILSLNVNSFALVDAAVYGGGAFKGEIEGNSKSEYSGWQYGAKAHYNFSIIPLIEMGIGAFVEHAKYKDTSDAINILTSKTFNNTTTGLDANLLLSLPIIHPYLRGTYGFRDNLDGDAENFKAYSYGLGVELSVFPFIRIFGEYMNKNTDHGSNFMINEFNLGLKVDI